MVKVDTVLLHWVKVGGPIVIVTVTFLAGSGAVST